MATTDSMSTELPADRYDADELGQYRSLSTMAVVSFVLGLSSVLMFASPLMVVLPLAAAAAALLALRGISLSEGGLTGSRLALAGLALAVLFGTGAYARLHVRDSLLQQQAEQTCQQWLDLASKGQVEEILGLMTSRATEKLKPKDELAEPGSIFGGLLGSALMRQESLVLELTKLRDEGEIEYRVTDSVVFATTKPVQARIRYAVSSASSDDSGEILCAFGLKRLKFTSDEQIWLIDSWTLE